MTQSLNLALDFSFETRDVCVEILLLGCRHRGLALHARHRTLEVDPLHHLVSMVLFQTIPFNDFKSYEPQRACVLQSLHSMNQSQPKASLCKRLRLPQAYENRVFSFGRGQLEHLAELQCQFQLYQGT